MTLEEAIIHCKEKACDNTQCAMEHRQLAEWLEELQEYRKNARKEENKQMAKGEKNVFKDAKFGDKFLTRNGQVMIYQKQAREDVYCLFDEESDFVIEYRPNGDVIYEYTGDAEPQEDDIVKKYVHPSDLDEVAR